MKSCFFISAIMILFSCHNIKEKEQIIIPIDPSKVIVINETDSLGRKQGRWDENDTINHRIKKIYYYKDNLLDGSYLEYKTNSADTLIFGFYASGKKTGEWKYWDQQINGICKIELYKNDTLKQIIKVRLSP